MTAHAPDGPLTLEELHELAVADPQWRGDYRNGSACRAQRDGDCSWPLCPQGRHYASHCPLDMPPFVVGGDDR